MRKDAKVELWQLKTSLVALASQLNNGVAHLDDLTSRTIARVIGEILQEIVSMADSITPEEISEWIGDVLVGTNAVKQELATKWYDELYPLMQRADDRASRLEHNLGDFTCLSVNGQEWGAVCLHCFKWVFITPDETRGVPLLETCRGLEVDNDRLSPPHLF